MICLVGCSRAETVQAAATLRRTLPKRLLWAVVFSVGCLDFSQVLAADEKPKLKPPEDVTLKTRDGLTLAATFYPSNLGKKAVPVILLHASKGTRADLAALAGVLHEAGHAVLAPDLRGHGDSPLPGLSARADGVRYEDCVAMVTDDLEAAKNFLMDRHNDGELNIDRLCLVGVEMGAVVAVNFAARDWSFPVLATGKQGQDVKALVLISPQWAFKGVRINEAMVHPNVVRDLSVLVIAGKESYRAMQDAKRLHGTLARHHPEPPSELAADQQMIWLRALPTSLQGTPLVNEKTMRVDRMISQFIDARLVKINYPWVERRRPHE
jgi:pimeloyl-ACP methyl ester carboxylesterase